MAPIADGNTFGGLFQAAPRSDVRLQQDRDSITELGFTIVAEDYYAGITKVWVYGSGTAVDAYKEDTNNLTCLPGLFFYINRGTEITEVLLRQWTDRNSLVRF